ncbi:MAG: hypothetical protein QXU43_07830 [Thermoproteota archaeon]
MSLNVEILSSRVLNWAPQVVEWLRDKTVHIMAGFYGDEQFSILQVLGGGLYE